MRNQGLEIMVKCIATGVGHIRGIVEALRPFLAVLEGCVEMSGIWYAWSLCFVYVCVCVSEQCTLD